MNWLFKGLACDSLKLDLKSAVEREKEQWLVNFLHLLLAGVKTSAAGLVCSFASSAAIADKALVGVLWPEEICMSSLTPTAV